MYKGEKYGLDVHMSLAGYELGGETMINSIKERGQEDYPI